MELLCINSLTSDAFSSENVGTKAFQTSVQVVPDIPVGLVGLSRDFVQTVTLKEVKLQGLSLLGGEFFPRSLQERPAVNFISQHLTLGVGKMVNLDFLAAVVMTGVQIPAAIKRAVVGHLDDP